MLASPLVYVGYRVYATIHHEHEVETEYRHEQELSAGQRDQLRQLIVSAPAKLAMARAARQRATAATALDKIEPGSGSSESVRAPTAEAAASYATYGSIDVGYFGHASFTFVRQGEPIGRSATSPTTASSRACARS